MGIVRIMSAGILHGDLPQVDITVDLRPYRDPHFDPTLKYENATNPTVYEHVLKTPGVQEELENTLSHILNLLNEKDIVTVVSFCNGGRHRGATVAMELSKRLQSQGIKVELIHRDINKPVVER